MLIGFYAENLQMRIMLNIHEIKRFHAQVGDREHKNNSCLSMMSRWVGSFGSVSISMYEVL
jgi:hypothetical protein